MADILCFSRNSCISVEQLDHQTVRSGCRIQDTFMDAFVEILVSLPDLELTQVKGEIRLSRQEKGVHLPDDLQRVLGSRVGPGIKKIIWGLIGHLLYAEQMAILMEECCNGVILSFTREVLCQVPKGRDGEKKFFANMVTTNPRLYNSCAALSKDSPLMEDLELVLEQDKKQANGGSDAKIHTK